MQSNLPAEIQPQVLGDRDGPHTATPSLWSLWRPPDSPGSTGPHVHKGGSCTSKQGNDPDPDPDPISWGPGGRQNGDCPIQALLGSPSRHWTTWARHTCSHRHCMSPSDCTLPHSLPGTPTCNELSPLHKDLGSGGCGRRGGWPDITAEASGRSAAFPGLARPASRAETGSVTSCDPGCASWAGGSGSSVTDAGSSFFLFKYREIVAKYMQHNIYFFTSLSVRFQWY